MNKNISLLYIELLNVHCSVFVTPWPFVALCVYKEGIKFCHMVYIYNLYMRPKTVNLAVVEKYKEL